jgi:molybdopterin converting factor small subunit
MHTVKVILFSNLRTKTGRKELRIDIQKNGTIADLLVAILQIYPMLRPHLTEKIIISINHKIADREDVIPVGAEVALMPPAGGG